MKLITFEKLSNAFELLGLLIVLILAFGLQFILHELPCPLCLLQRVGFIGIGIGFLLNLQFGFRPSHYALALASALFTAGVALRQIALHIVPGTGSYGSAIFGIHLYSWSFLFAFLVIVYTVIILGFDFQYRAPENSEVKKTTTRILGGLLLLLAISNAVSGFMECGFNACPDDPVHYKYAQAVPDEALV
ncbi:MAG: disulfide bond formation protein B [Gammaproteobacteria bacterium]|nr:disulfide bond formation protein B [Gammaproteobacteria bacterium]